MIETIPVYKASVPSLENVLPYLAEMHESQIFSNNGPLVRELESRIGKLFGFSPEHVCTVTNATLGLLGAIQTSHQIDNDISIPSWTFAATVLAGVQSGARICLSDVSEDHRSKASDNKNSVEVLPFGATLRECESFLIDAAASFDAATSGAVHLKSHQGLVVSLHATKSLPAGEGGFFLSHDLAWVDRVRSWCAFGFKPGSRQSELTGLNAKMPEVSAAYGLAALDQWPVLRAKQLSLKERYIVECNRRGIIVAPPSLEIVANPYFLISVDPEKKQSLVENLARNGVETRDWWGDGAHKMPAFQNLDREPMRTTEYLASSTLGLPFWLGINPDKLFRIVGEAHKVLELESQ